MFYANRVVSYYTLLVFVTGPWISCCSHSSSTSPAENWKWNKCTTYFMPGSGYQLIRVVSESTRFRVFLVRGCCIKWWTIDWQYAARTDATVTVHPTASSKGEPYIKDTTKSAATKWKSAICDSNRFDRCLLPRVPGSPIDWRSIGLVANSSWLWE